MRQPALSRRAFITNGGLAAIALSSRPLHSLASTSAVTIQTASGGLVGERSGGVLVFRGIPFAEPPVGPLRFRPPVKMKPWPGQREATRFAAAAMQSGGPGLERSEDCLYLNLWAPSGKGPFPVYVWIHGGGFTGGHSFEPMYDGTELAKQGIVCVTVAYRLGVFGFLDVEPLLGAEFAGSANNGLRDLIASLEWVRENIAAFGGDPEHVTIGGESAGAKLTDILMGVPSARPLFRQMISESGGGERVATRDQSLAVAQGFSQEWRAGTGGDFSSVLTAPASSLIEVQRRFIQKWPMHFPLRVEIDGSLLPRLPVNSITAGSSHRKRLLVGTNRDESAAFLGPHPVREVGAADLGNMQAAKFAEVYGKYKEVYPLLSEQQLRIRAATTEEYWVPSIRVADAHVTAGGSAWMYRLDFAETSGLMRGYAFHSLDLRLVWDRPSDNVENAVAEEQLAHQMHRAWIAFLRGQEPGAEGLPSWPEYRAGARATMIFDTESHVEGAPQESELRLWDGFL